MTKGSGTLSLVILENMRPPCLFGAMSHPRIFVEDPLLAIYRVASWISHSLFEVWCPKVIRFGAENAIIIANKLSYQLTSLDAEKQITQGIEIAKNNLNQCDKMITVTCHLQVSSICIGPQPPLKVNQM